MRCLLLPPPLPLHSPPETPAKEKDWKTYSVTLGVARQFPVRLSRAVELW
jgi:hypothetical protein